MMTWNASISACSLNQNAEVKQPLDRQFDLFIASLFFKMSLYTMLWPREGFKLKSGDSIFYFFLRTCV